MEPTTTQQPTLGQVQFAHMKAFMDRIGAEMTNIGPGHHKFTIGQVIVYTRELNDEQHYFVGHDEENLSPLMGRHGRQFPNDELFIELKSCLGKSEFGIESRLADPDHERYTGAGWLVRHFQLSTSDS